MPLFQKRPFSNLFSFFFLLQTSFSADRLLGIAALTGSVLLTKVSRFTFI